MHHQAAHLAVRKVYLLLYFLQYLVWTAATRIERGEQLCEKLAMATLATVTSHKVLQAPVFSGLHTVDRFSLLHARQALVNVGGHGRF